MNTDEINPYMIHHHKPSTFRLRIALLFFVFSLLCSCSYNTSADYGKYISESTTNPILQQKMPQACYYLPYPTQHHYYSFNSFMGGYYTTEWEVELGKMIDATFQNSDVYQSFSLYKKVIEPKCFSGPVIVVEVDSYTFTACQAHTAITFTVRQGDQTIMANHYAAVGKKQCGKMYWGGTFLMKNAVQQSTKDALEKVLTLFVKDLSAATSKNALN